MDTQGTIVVLIYYLINSLIIQLNLFVVFAAEAIHWANERECKTFFRFFKFCFYYVPKEVRLRLIAYHLFTIA